MENSTLETLTNRFSYSHPKSHLKSQTFLTLFDILSGSHNNSQPAAPILSPIINPGFNDKNEAPKECDKDSEKVGSESKENEDVAEQNVIKDDRIKGGDDNQLQRAIDELECTMNKLDDDDELFRDECSDGDLFGDFEKLIVDDLVDFQQLLCEEVKNSNEVPKFEEFSHNQNLIIEASRPIKNDDIERISASIGSSKQLDNQVQQNDKELEKLDNNDNGLSPRHILVGTEEVEDGEISGDSGTSQQPRDLFIEDCIVSEENNVDTARIGTSDVVDAMCSKGKLSSSIKEKKTEDATLAALDNGRGVQRDSQQFGRDKESFYSFGTRGDPVFYGDILVEKNHDVSKKRKQGGNSKEKKKRNRGKKRVEKNRLLGVKRLKLHPISKPKVVKICKHYLKGRCRKGGECSFSHDAVPLTKSKPCSHFARNSCMKGDDCPFDHELSKYPCNNYATEGFCIRGENCLFSHKVLTLTWAPSKEVSPPASDISKTHLISKPPSWPGVFPSKNNEHNVTKVAVKPPSQAPKGINFISLGRSSAQDSLVFDHLDTDSGSTQVQKSLPSPKRILPPTSLRGISSVKSPPNYSSSKNEDKLYFVPLDKQGNTSVSSLSNLSKLKGFDLSPKKSSGSKFGNQKDESTSDVLQGMHKISFSPPLVQTPFGINLLPFGKSPEDVTSGQKQISLLPYQDGVSSMSILEKGRTLEKPQNPFSISQKVPVSPFTLPPCSDGYKSMSSLSQKALLSTISFASKYRTNFRMNQSNKEPAGLPENRKVSETGSNSGNLRNKPVDASTILDFILGSGGKTKQ